MKKGRLSVVAQIVRENNVSNQWELQDLLREHNYDVAQATISRDIKELRLTKKLSEDGSYRYVLPDEQEEEGHNRSRLGSILRSALISVEACGQLVVIRCHVGTGSAVGVSLDAMKLPDIVGTIAGDDTIFVAVRSEKDGKAVAKLLGEYI